METAPRKGARSLYETKANCILPLGGLPHDLSQVISISVWHVPSLGNIVALALSWALAYNQGSINPMRPSPACCPCATDRTHTITPGLSLPAKERKTANLWGTDHRWVGSATAARGQGASRAKTTAGERGAGEPGHSSPWTGSIEG